MLQEPRACAGAEEHEALLSYWRPVVPVTNIGTRRPSAQLHSTGMEDGSSEHGPIGINAFGSGP